MIASLPMYIRAENKTAHNRYWQLIRTGLIDSGIDAPQFLENDESLDHWQRDDLVLSQTCGMPYRLFLHDKVQLLGTPDYGLDDCPAGYYNSVFIANANDTRTTLTDFSSAKLAVNSKISQSGFCAPQTEAKKAGFQFETLSLSGTHVASAKMVATGRADIAAIDAFSWRNIERYDSFSDDIKILGRTAPTPGLPYICALGLDIAAVTQAITRAIAALSPDDRERLGIQSLIPIPKADYLAIENP